MRRPRSCEARKAVATKVSKPSVPQAASIAALAPAAGAIASGSSRASWARPRHQAASGPAALRSSKFIRPMRASIALRVADAPPKRQSSVAAATPVASRRSVPGRAGDKAARRNAAKRAAGPALVLASRSTAAAQASSSSGKPIAWRLRTRRSPPASPSRWRAICLSSASALPLAEVASLRVARALTGRR